MKGQLISKVDKSKPSLLFNLKEGAKITIKFIGILTWLVVFGMALLEVKHYYNIDVIPGVDTSIEDVYSFVFGFLK